MEWPTLCPQHRNKFNDVEPTNKQYLQSVSFCRLCQMGMLSALPFDELISETCIQRYGPQMRNKHEMIALSICFALTLHPQMPIVWAKAFTNNRPCFDIIFNIFRLAIKRYNVVNHSLCSGSPHSFAEACFCVCFLLSAKYWAPALLKEVQDHYARQILELMVKYAEFRSECNNVLCQINPYVLHLMPCTSEQLFRDSQVQVANIRRVIKKYHHCCFCRELQFALDSKMKVCGGCKMAYYCSRSCQKEAWPSHKPTCVKLRSMYALWSFTFKVNFSPMHAEWFYAKSNNLLTQKRFSFCWQRYRGDEQ